MIVGEGPAARTMRLHLKPFTLIGATTRTGLLSSPLRDRFGQPFQLEFYDQDHLLSILERSANLLKVKLEKHAGNEIARRSRGTPRIANRLLRRVRDFADVENNSVISMDLTQSALLRLGVDPGGLDSMDRRYLLTVIDKFDGGPVGIETISAALSEKRDTLEDVYEPYLLQEGFIQRTPRGRVVTRRGYEHLAKIPPGNK
jgi:Holliday junction DNA helicase RuvB